MLSSRADWIAVVETLYEETADATAWATSSVGALGRAVALDERGGAAIVILEHGPQASRRAVPFVAGVGRSAGFNLAADVAPLSPALFDALLYSQNLAQTMSEAARRVPPEDRPILKAMWANWGAEDAVGLVAHPEPGVVAFLAWPTYTRRSLTKHERTVLSQIALHLESACRVRRRPESVLAILKPDGTIVHCEHDELATSEVADRVRRIDKSRARRFRRGPEALDIWTALIEGQVSVVERFDGGRRYYLLVDNAPSTRSHRTLSKRELEVVRLSARGLSTKLMAYGLGLSPPTISNALATAAAKLGLKSRSDLVRVASLLIDSPRRQVAAATLTATEREVFELVRMGLSNADIAASRARSVHTVANQVSSLLRKTTSSTRRGLIASTTDS
jgi:DNA-binding CsgD family transcriptional regulator